MLVNQDKDDHSLFYTYETGIPAMEWLDGHRDLNWNESVLVMDLSDRKDKTVSLSQTFEHGMGKSYDVMREYCATINPDMVLFLCYVAEIPVFVYLPYKKTEVTVSVFRENADMLELIEQELGLDDKVIQEVQA